jgi:hypothetical protein
MKATMDATSCVTSVQVQCVMLLPKELGQVATISGREKK